MPDCQAVDAMFAALRSSADGMRRHRQDAPRRRVRPLPGAGARQSVQAARALGGADRQCVADVDHIDGLITAMSLILT